jgi:hypothetical protein
MGTGGIKNIGLSPLDTARLPTQTKFSIFKQEFKMAGVEGRGGGPRKPNIGGGKTLLFPPWGPCA